MPDAHDGSYIAQLTLPALTPDGQRHTVSVAIGAPIEGDDSEWHCRFRVEGLGHQSSGAISGADALQALCLTMSFVSQSLRSMLEAGNRLLTAEDPADPDDDDIDWPIEAYFGPFETGDDLGDA